MTNQQHPITPPSELVTIWTGTPYGYRQAARWGADQELEACCEWIERVLKGWGEDLTGDITEKLRAARRHEPEWKQRSALLRRALESLPE